MRAIFQRRRPDPNPGGPIRGAVRRPLFRAFRFSLLAVLLARAVSAQTQAPADALDKLVGRPVADVRLMAEGREVRDSDIRRVIETQVGLPLTLRDVRASIVHLMAIGRFEDVTVEAQDDPRGVVLIYGLTPVHAVKGIEFRGDLGLPARQLRTAVVERYTSVPPASRADEIATMLEGVLRDRGYLKAVVRSAPEVTHDPDRTVLAFQVTAGAPARVGAISIEGVPDGDRAAVASRLGLQAGARFDRLALEDAMSRYTESLRVTGYLEAKIEPLEFTYAADRGVVDVAVRMTRGRRVTIEFRGDALPDARRAGIAALLRTGALDEDLLENEQRSIEDEFRSRGYQDAAAPFTREPRGDDQLLIVFTVKRGVQYRVGAVDLTGCQQIPRSEIQPVLKVVPGQWFVKARVDADAAAVADVYRKRGFSHVAVTWSPVPQPGAATQVVVRIAIVEGTRTTISAVNFERASAVPHAILQQVVSSQPGGPYFRPLVEADRDAVQLEYVKRGYQLAAVTVPPDISPDGTRFNLRFVVDEGPHIVVDHILVVGNARTRAAIVERETGLKPGMSLSFVDLAEAQRRLSALGLFRKVQVTELRHDGDNRRDVVVTVEEAPVNTIGYGGGLEGALRDRTNAATGLPEERFDLAPRGFFEIGRRNLWGKNRSIDLFARGAIRTSDQFNTAAGGGTPVQPLSDTSSGFREYRLLGTYREPRFLNTPIDVVVTAAVDQAIRSAFDFNRRQVYVEGSHRFRPTLSIAGRYSFGRTRLFNERIAPESQLDVDKVFSRVRLSAFSASIIRSTRDDAFEPTRGTLAAFDGTIAARRIGSEVGFIKVSWQGFLYRQLPILRGAVLAVGARVGLATGFPQLVLDPNGTGRLVTLEQEIPASERFFAGGDTTVRGFALDRLGAAKTLDQNGVSTGGNGLLIFNSELRFPIWPAKTLGAAVFIDAGNVFARVGDMSPADLRTGAGFGIRWKSPVGPLRIDLAWKLKPLQFASGARENRFAWYVTIGQAF